MLSAKCWSSRTDLYAESHTVDHPLHAARGRARSPIRPQGEQRCDSLDREHLRARRVPDLAAAGADVLGAAFRARLQVPRGHTEQLDSLDWRGLQPRHRRHLVSVDHTDHAAGMDLDSFFVDRHRDPGEGILRLVPGVADGNARRLHGTRFFPLLRFLGSDAGADVSADRHLGRSAQTLCRYQVLSLHVVWLGTDAAWHPVPLLPSPHGYWRLHIQHSRAL